MIEFDCPSCGKHFSFRIQFAGRKMFCAECKTNIVVPEPGHSSAILEENSSDSSESSGLSFALPEIVSEKKRVPVPPPLPPGYEKTPPPLPGTNVPGSPNTVSSGNEEELIPLSLGKIDEELEVLSYIYEEKHRQKSGVVPPPVPQPAVQPPQLSTVNLSRQRWVGWLKLALLLFFLAGSGAALAWYLNLPGPDERLAVLNQIEQRHFDATVQSRKKETEAAAVQLRSGDLWLKTGELIDNYIVTLREPGGLTPGSAAEKRLKTIAADIQAESSKAAESEQQRREIFQQSEMFKAEAVFWETQKKQLQEKIHQFPNKREPVSMPAFEPPVYPEERLRFDSDWTENRFAAFEFEEPTAGSGQLGERKDTINQEGETEKNTIENQNGLQDNNPPLSAFFAVPDRVKHIFGSQSLRISVQKKVPVTFRFPIHFPIDGNLQTAKSILFALRFPEQRSRILPGKTPETGQIGEYRIRFRNKTGYVDLFTDFRRYCEAVFYDAREEFLIVEVPLNGNEFWKRENHYNSGELKTENGELGDARVPQTESVNPPLASSPIPVTHDPFFAQIDTIEFSVIPLSECTTFWLDGITVSDKVSREPYDIVQAEQRQETVREKEKEFYREQQAQISVTKKEENSSAEPLPEHTDSLLRWILQTAGGRVVLRSNGKIITLSADSQVPVFLDGVTVEEIDLSGFGDLTDERLEQLGGRKDIKRLDLSRTGLTDEALIKIAGIDSLEYLNLSENKLTFAGLPSIRTLKKLRELHLNGMKADARGIEGLASLTDLRILSVSRSEIDSGDLNYLIPLADLEVLDLSGTKIGDKATVILRVFPELRSLNLSNTRISNDGLTPLQNLKKLHVLQLDGTALDDSCLNRIGRIPSPEMISVQKTGITKEGVRKNLGSVWLGRFKFSE